jgi:hypothetical protein
MRAGALLAAFLGGWLCCGTGQSFAAPVAKTVTVAEIAAAQGAFNGQRLKINGVMVGGNSWVVCSPLLKPDAGSRTNYGAAHCIDMRKAGHKFDAQAEKYHGAVVVIDGIYWNRCLPGVRALEPEQIQERCEYNAVNGELGPIGVRILDYVALRDPEPEHHASWNEIGVGSPGAAGIEGFVKAFVAAAATRDVDAMLKLFHLTERGRRRVWLKTPSSREHWQFFTMAPRHVRATVAKAGYRLYSTVGVAGAICFCRKASCEGKWPGPRDEVLAVRSIRAPIACFRITRVGGEWYLD